MRGLWVAPGWGLVPTKPRPRPEAWGFQPCPICREGLEMELSPILPCGEASTKSPEYRLMGDGGAGWVVPGGGMAPSPSHMPGPKHLSRWRPVDSLPHPLISWGCKCQKKCLLRPVSHPGKLAEPEKWVMRASDYGWWVSMDNHLDLTHYWRGGRLMGVSPSPVGFGAIPR